MKRGLLLVLASAVLVFVLLTAGMALAAKDNATGDAADDNETAKPEKNMTYGQCVVEGVQIKNACYEVMKRVRADCIANAVNDTAVVKQCKADYKKEMKQCKADFKGAKKTCIQKTKPGLWEKLRYSMA